MQTREEALTAFLDELHTYVAQPSDGSEDAKARYNVVQAHITRVSRILDTPELRDTESAVVFQPGDAEVAVSVPSGHAPTVFRFGRTQAPAGGNVLDLRLAVALLEHALGEARQAFATAQQQASSRPYYPVPVVPTAPPPGW